MFLFAYFQSMQEFGSAVGGSLVFGLIGIVLLVIGFKAFDLMTPKLDVAPLTIDRVSDLEVIVGAVEILLGIVVPVLIGIGMTLGTAAPVSKHEPTVSRDALWVQDS